MTTFAAPSATAPTGRARQFLDVIRSEFYKLRSVRSTFWTLAAAVGFNLVIAGLAAAFIPPHLSPAEIAKTDAIRLSLAGLHLSQIAIGVLGALIITSEYGTGSIWTTFAAVPQRGVVLAAKTLVFTAAAMFVGLLSSFGAYEVFQAFLSGDQLRSSLSDPGVLRAVCGGGLYLAALGIFGLGLGTILRSSTGAIATLFGILFVPQILIGLLPNSWQSTVGPYLPMQAGSDIFIANRPEAGSLGPWVGFTVFTMYAVVALVVGFVLISRRDA